MSPHMTSLTLVTACVVVSLVWFAARLRRTGADPTIPDDATQEQILRLVADTLQLPYRSLPRRITAGDGQYTVLVGDSHEGLHAVTVWTTGAIRPAWVIAANVWESGVVQQRVLSLPTETGAAVRRAVDASSWTPEGHVDHVVLFDGTAGRWEVVVTTDNPHDGLAGEIQALVRPLPVGVRVLVRARR